MRKHHEAGYYFAPTDLVNFLGCSHCTVLDLLALSEKLKPDEPSAGDKLLQQKGQEHETAYLNKLKTDGKQVAEIPGDIPLADRSQLTKEAMQQGADVIYQATLLGRTWGGYADFLIKTGRPSKFGPCSYEATDTKLARQAQVKHLVQLGVYSELLAGRQETAPQQAHVALGDGTLASYLVADSDAYVRHAMQRLEMFSTSAPADSYPEPCSHCTHCRWQETCAEQWQHDDHLSLVANIQRSQRVKLERAGVTTLAQLANLPSDARIPDLHPQVLQRLRAQAALQEHKRLTGENKLELHQTEAGRGFFRLPKPDVGDLFFDIEGDPLFPDGLEYLLGVCFHDRGQLIFKSLWAHDHDEERAAFAQFMEFLGQHLTKYPNAFIYHYNHYETTALKRLACRHALAEHQLDDLLRRKKFVDLYQVVREAVRVSEPAYSLKNLETFYMEKRAGEVATAGDSIVVYNQWRETREPQLLAEIATYNKVDCISTAKLRDWLLTHRPQQLAWFTGDSESIEPEKAAEILAARQARETRYAEFRERLLATAGEPNDFRRPLVDLLEFHARENRPQWWEFFDRQNRFEDELIDDTECLSGLKLIGEPEPVKRSLLHKYHFPPQETKLAPGDQVIDVATLQPAGTIKHLDDDKLIVGIQRAASKGPLPKTLSVGPGGPIDSDPLREAIYRFAADVLAGNNHYSALRDILSKSAPRIRGRRIGEPIAQGADLVVATTEAVADLDNSYLFIQGPPGAGKTYTSAHVIVELIRRGKKVGVSANSHKAIHNLLKMIEQTATEAGFNFKGMKKSSMNSPDTVYDGDFIQSESKVNDIDLDASLLAGTAWLFAHERLDFQLDYLFIDEAGQVSVANVVAMGTSARNMVLVGDQMQLGQPIQGVHPGEAGLSVLDFLLGDQPTVAPDRGVFLNQTRRLHPSICKFISEAFYEGRLEPDPENVNRQLKFKSSIDGIGPDGIYFRPIVHSGCSQKSEEEVKVVKELFEQLVDQTFVNKDGKERLITADDILVVSPYNVQVNYLRSILPAIARVGTVDKFQGQEAPIVLVSMATSDAECLPRDIEFLFSANRLNVAVSRAQCLAILVASPKLMETPCRTISQLRLVNKFCQLAEYTRPS